MAPLTSTLLRAQANRRIEDAVAEATEQLANGWTLDEVLVVLRDAAAIVGDLFEQADAVDDVAATLGSVAA